MTRQWAQLEVHECASNKRTELSPCYDAACRHLRWRWWMVVSIESVWYRLDTGCRENELLALC
jgi:hypothetical protein